MSDPVHVEKIRVVMSNYWHRPGITIKLIHDTEDAPNGAIELSITLADFLQALFHEMKDPALEVQFANAVASTLAKVKVSSVGNVQ